VVSHFQSFSMALRTVSRSVLFVQPLPRRWRRETLVAFFGLLAAATSSIQICQGFEIAQTRFLGSVWNQGHADASIISQDGGSSYATPDGSAWWFGDTFKGTRDVGGRPLFAGGGVSCCVALLPTSAVSAPGDRSAAPPELTFLKNNEGNVAQAISFLPEESWERHRIWPLAGVYVNGRSYVYYTLIEIGPAGGWDFHAAGAGLAAATSPLSVHNRVQVHGEWKFPVSPTAILPSDSWLYLFEVEKRDDRQALWLACVRPERIEEPNAYMFYAGPGPRFSADSAERQPLLDDIYGQASVVWNPYLDKYVLASSSNFFHPREIRFHTADQPYGPWSEPVARATVPERCQGKKVTLVYCAYFHPALFREEGRVMNLTFSVHLEEAGFDANNEMLEVELAPLR